MAQPPGGGNVRCGMQGDCLWHGRTAVRADRLIGINAPARPAREARPVARPTVPEGALTEDAAMVGLTLSPEQIRAAPPEVRRWLEQEIAASLGFDPPAHRMDPPSPHPASVGAAELRALLGAIGGLLPVVAVFFELGREAAASPAPGLRAYRLGEILRHTRLAAPEQVLAAMEVLNDALRRLRGDPAAELVAVDPAGVCYVAEETARNVLALWQEIVAARALDEPGAPVQGLRGPHFEATMPLRPAGMKMP